MVWELLPCGVILGNRKEPNNHTASCMQLHHPHIATTSHTGDGTVAQESNIPAAKAMHGAGQN